VEWILCIKSTWPGILRSLHNDQRKKSQRKKPVQEEPVQEDPAQEEPVQEGERSRLRYAVLVFTVATR